MKYYRAKPSIQEQIAQYKKINAQIVPKVGCQFGKWPSYKFFSRLVDIGRKERFSNHSLTCYAVFKWMWLYPYNTEKKNVQKVREFIIQKIVLICKFEKQEKIPPNRQI